MFTGFGGVIASRSTLFESFLMSSMTDENPPFSDKSDVVLIFIAVIFLFGTDVNKYL